MLLFFCGLVIGIGATAMTVALYQAVREKSTDKTTGTTLFAAEDARYISDLNAANGKSQKAKTFEAINKVINQAIKDGKTFAVFDIDSANWEINKGVEQNLTRKEVIDYYIPMGYFIEFKYYSESTIKKISWGRH